MSKRRLLNPVTTYLHLSALLPSITIRMAALSALFHLCGYYLSLLLRRACLLVSSMITFIAPSAMLPQPDLLLSSRLLLRPPRLGGGWSLVRSRLSYLPLIPTYSMLVVERARLYPGVMIPFPRPIRKRAAQSQRTSQQPELIRSTSKTLKQLHSSSPTRNYMMHSSKGYRKLE